MRNMLRQAVTGNQPHDGWHQSTELAWTLLDAFLPRLYQIRLLSQLTLIVFPSRTNVTAIQIYTDSSVRTVRRNAYTQKIEIRLPVGPSKDVHRGEVCCRTKA